MITEALERSDALGRQDGAGQFGLGHEWQWYGETWGKAAAGRATVGTDGQEGGGGGGGPVLGLALPPWLLLPQACNYLPLPASPEAFWLHNLWRTLCKWALCKSSLSPRLLDSWTLINLPKPHVAVPSTPAQPPARSPNQEIHLQRQAWSNRSLIWMCGLSPTPLAGRRRRHFSQLTLLLPIQLQNKCLLPPPPRFISACFKNQKQLWGKLMQFLIIFKSFFYPILPYCKARGPIPSLPHLLKDALREGSGSCCFLNRTSKNLFRKALIVNLFLNVCFWPGKKPQEHLTQPPGFERQWNLSSVHTNDASRVTQQGMDSNPASLPPKLASFFLPTPSPTSLVSQTAQSKGAVPDSFVPAHFQVQNKAK